jgi:hypothetical protein
LVLVKQVLLEELEEEEEFAAIKLLPPHFPAGTLVPGKQAAGTLVPGKQALSVCANVS